jgi:hypothetical protein
MNYFIYCFGAKLARDLLNFTHLTRWRSLAGLLRNLSVNVTFNLCFY